MKTKQLVDGKSNTKNAIRLAKLLNKTGWFIMCKQNDSEEKKQILEGLRRESERIAEEVANVLCVSPKLRRIYGDDLYNLEDEIIKIAEIEPTFTELVNNLIEALTSGTDKTLIERILRETADAAIEIAEDREVADQQTRLLALSETDMELAQSSTWYTEDSDVSAVEFAVSRLIEERVCLDDGTLSLYSSRCSSLLILIGALLDEHGPRMVARCVEIISRNLDASKESLSKRRGGSSNRTLRAVKRG